MSAQALSAPPGGPPSPPSGPFLLFWLAFILMHPLGRHSWSARNIFGFHRRTLRGAEIVERKRVPAEGDLLGGNSRAGKSFDHVALNPTRHRADEVFPAVAACRRN